ncbi:MAG: metallophosphoesterase [Bacteroidota bacterium]
MLLFLGDVHGEFPELSKKIVRYQISNASIIQVGDFGIGFRIKQEIEELQVLNSILAESNSTLYTVRGNHDDPSFFTGRSAFSNIVFVQDYTLLTVEGHNILLVGGAVSVDRSVRALGSDYWKDEVFTYNEKLLTDVLANVSSLDIVVTHNAPTEFWPYTFDGIVSKFAQRDDLLLRDLQQDRGNYSRLLKHLQVMNLLPESWYYGHFHASYQAIYNSITYTLLDCMELIEHFPQTLKRS